MSCLLSRTDPAEATRKRPTPLRRRVPPGTRRPLSKIRPPPKSPPASSGSPTRKGKGILKTSPAALPNWETPPPNIEVNVLVRTCPQYPHLALLGYYFRPIMQRLYDPEHPPANSPNNTDTSSKSSRTRAISWDPSILDNAKPILDPPKNTTPRDYMTFRPTMSIELPLTFAKMCPTMQQIVWKIAQSWPQDGEPTSEGFPIDRYCRWKVEEDGEWFRKCLDNYAKGSGCLEDKRREEKE